MKKSIGLTADISTFNTNLPQTRHLNYFMGTNPRRYANGGDVNQGIPNYPNSNVTSGFLPMALGFDNKYPVPMAEAGDVGFFSKLYNAAVEVVAGYLKKSPNDPDVQETAKKFISTEEGKKIAEQYLQSQEGQNQTPGLTSDGLNLTIPAGTPPPPPPQNQNQTPGLMPTDTVTATPTPPIQNQNQTPGLMPTIPQNQTPGGITTVQPPQNQNQTPGLMPVVKPEKAGMLDLNGDGEVNMKDLDFAIENGLEWAIPMLKKILGIVEDWNPDKPEEVKPEEVEPEEVEPEEVKPKIKPKIKPSVLTPPPQNQNQTPGLMSPKGGITEINKEDSKEVNKALKIADDLASGGDGGIKNAKDKKDVPSWALPMMSAGFAMMASKSPYFMQALGEAGQAGVESYSAQETAKEDKLDKQASREQSKAMAEYYQSREQKPDIKILTVDGKGIYHKWDSKKQNYVSLDKVAVPSDAEIATELETLYGADLWNIKTFDEKQKLITEKRNQYLGIASDNVTSGNQAAQGGGNWLEEWKETIESWNQDRDD